MHRWTVKEVMTEEVVSVSPEAPYKEIVEALAQHTVSAVPVVDAAGKVIGIVSEADLLHKMEFSGPEPHIHLLERKQRRDARAKATGDVACDLMSSPVVTVSADASLTAVAKMMDHERVKRLPVVDEQGRLIGIVARRDLLRVYLRSDEAIRDDVQDQVLRHVLRLRPESVTVSVDRGIVTLRGTTDRRTTAQMALWLCQSIGGVVGVEDELRYEHDDTMELGLS